MSKAFDTFNHDILLDKLSYLGIYSFDGQHSEMAHITTGVPQESILDLLLFLTYINDFLNTSAIFLFYPFC